jgi:hypothetical protein
MSNAHAIGRRIKIVGNFAAKSEWEKCRASKNQAGVKQLAPREIAGACEVAN